MLHPSYKELMEKVNQDKTGDEVIVASRYSIVLGTAKRARQITSAEERKRFKEGAAYVPPKRKALSVSVDEFMNDEVHIIKETGDDFEEAEAQDSVQA
ncbi:MAG: DNA-directed RNA polymerase subunit omega [Lachnospiraceae bacterium]|nr:DNA-directed RNA polymerase subunit omega [Candidatus Minthocola equi]